MGRRPRARRHGAAAAAVVGLVFGSAAASHAATTEYRGAFTCSDGRPLAGARVELWQQHVRWLPRIPPNYVMRNAVRADANGAWGFRVSGDETNWVIRLVLVGEDAAVQDFPWGWNWWAETLRSQNDRPLRDYGTQLVSGYQCALFNAFGDAGREYRALMGSAPPQGPTVVKAGALTAGVPFTLYDEVWWPSGYRIYDSQGRSTATHEFAHVVRHRFDGGLGHFLADSSKYWYLRHHSSTSCERTNSGFAFNEGWAEYWAGEVNPPCPSDPSTGLIERNVAAALQRLQTSCGLGRDRMLRVLIEHRVHSIDEYTAALNCTPRRPIRRLGRARRPIGALLEERRVVLAAGRKVVAALDTTVARLGRRAAAAKRLVRRPVPCETRPCAEELERRVLPVLLEGQLAQARSVRETFAFLADRAEVRDLVDEPVSRQLRLLQEVRRSAVAEAAAIGVRTLRLARRAAQRFGADRASLSILARAQAAVARRDLAALTGVAPVAPVTLRQIGPSPPPPLSPPPPAPPVEPPVPSPEPPAPPPDLVVDRVFLTDSPAWTWNVEVRNAGAGRAPESRTGLKQPDRDEVLLDTPALEAGASVTLTLECPYGSLAEATARADAEGAVGESDEANNDASGAGGTGGRCRYP